MFRKDFILKHFKTIFPIILGIIAGYGLTLQVFSELIPVLIGTQGFVYPLVLYSTLVFTILLFTIIFQILIAKKISQPLLVFLMLTYFIILLASLFFRHSYESFFIVNPLVGFLDTISNLEMLLQSVLNIFIFIPMGYFFKDKNILVTISISAAISFMVEMIQYVFKLGFFDTFDCILYITGVCFGRYTFKKIMLIREKQSMKK